MTKATQRVLSLLLAAVLLFGMFPMSAYAAEAEQAGVAAPEVNVTGPPEVTESEPAESVGNDTISAETIPERTDGVETAVPTTEPEITPGEEVTEPAATVPNETAVEETTTATIPTETEPTETVPETEPVVTEPTEIVSEVTEGAEE